MRLKTMLCSAAALVGLTVPLAASADGEVATGATRTNPVTGETETYDNVFTGAGETATEWNSADNWTLKESEKVPFVSGGNYDPALVDGKTVSTSTAIDGWTLRVGAYNGAAVTWSGGISKIQAGSVGCWLTADETSSITIASFGGAQLEGSAAAPFKLTSENAGGITWSAGLTSASNTTLPFWYYLKGEGTVVYGGDITVANQQVIKAADVTLSGNAKSVQSKTLVTFGSGTTATFTADAAIKIGDDNAVLKTVYLTSVTANATTLTTDDDVGACELVQTSTGIDLYWVDGDPAALPAPTVYKPSININFTNGAANGLTTGADVGLAGYEVPGTSWNNYVVGNSTFSTVNAVDSTGAASAMSGVSVTISGTRGSYSCSSLTPANNPLHGYIDENAGNPTPTVTVTGIPYYKYRVIVYHSTDTENAPFGYDTINGTNYTYVDSNLTEGTTAWGSSGPDYGANAIAEGGNVLVTGELSGSTLTVVGHRAGGDSNARGCISAIQIIEVELEVGENDLEIPVSGDTPYTVSEAKELSGTVYLTGSGTLTLDGEAKISAATIEVGELVTLNVNADLLDGTTFTGAGTVVYDGVVPPTGKGWTESTWTGTVWIKNQTISQFEGNQFGNADSTIRFTGVTGFLQTNTYNSLGYVHTVPLELVDDGSTVAFTYNNGWSGYLVKINTLKGTGTLQTQGSGAGEHIYIVDASGFTGSFNLTGKYVYVGGSQPENTPTTNPNGKLEIRAGTTLTVPAGKTWTANGGFVVDGALVANGTLASSAGTAVSGSGTVTFGGVPSPTGDAWWKNAAWTGTVEIKDATALNGDYTFNDYGNAGSTLKLTNCSGWLKPNYTCVPAIEIGGTFTWNDGSSNLGNTFKVATLKGSGTISIPNQGAATAVWQITDDWSGFTGVVVGNNTAAKRVLVFGSTLPATITAGEIYVSEGATLNLDNASGAWWGVGMGFVVDGTVKASARNKWGGGTYMTLGDTGVLELATFSGYVNDINNSYANVTGTGTVRYTGSNNNWRSLPNGDNMFATTLSIELENEAGVVFHGGDSGTGTVGSIFGTKNLRSDLGNYNKVLTIKQAEDGVWSGSFLGGDDRLDTFIVDPGDTTTGTLTLAGTHTQDNNMTVNGSVNLTGTWVGATTVAGTFGGTGTLTGDLTFAEGSTFKAFAADEDGLAVSGTITYPDNDGKVTVVLASGLEGTIGLITKEGIDATKFELAAGAPEGAALSVVDNTLTVSVPVTVATLVNVQQQAMENYEDMSVAISALAGKSGNWTLYVQKSENTVESLSVPADLNLTVIENGGTIAATTTTVANGGTLVVRGGSFTTINVAGSVTVWAASSNTSVVITSADFTLCRVYDVAASNVTVTTTVAAKETAAKEKEEGATYTDWELTDASATSITIDDDGCNFKVDAATQAAITDAFGVATTDANFAQAAIAYVVGGTLDGDKVVIPTPTITVSGTTVTVTFTSTDAKVNDYTITAKLQYATGLASPMVWADVDSAVMSTASTSLTDTVSANDTSKFYQVVVTVADKSIVE